MFLAWLAVLIMVIGVIVVVVNGYTKEKSVRQQINEMLEYGLIKNDLDSVKDCIIALYDLKDKEDDWFFPGYYFRETVKEMRTRMRILQEFKNEKKK